MNKGEQLYNKYLEYKQKYLNNVKENKTLFTENYRKKANHYLYEASKEGHPQAAYDYAVYASNNSFEAKEFVIKDHDYDDLSRIRYASELNHPDGNYYYALCLLKNAGSSNETLIQAKKVLAQGRPQDYIPLVLYYANLRTDGYVPRFSKYTSHKKELFELLDQHKPDLSHAFIEWNYNVAYISGLVEFDRLKEARESLDYLKSHMDLFENRVKTDLELIEIEILCKEGEMRKAVELYKKNKYMDALNLIRDYNNSYIYSRDITDLFKFDKRYLSATEVYDLYKEKLLGGNGELPKTQTELEKYNTYENREVIFTLAGHLWTSNKNLAFIYYLVSIKNGYMYYERLADCYFYGYGTTIDYKKALEYYEKAAIISSGAVTLPDSKGDLLHYNIVETHVEERARCYYGLKEYDKAFPLFKQLAQTKYKDNPPLWFVVKMGYMYFYGEGTPVNYQEAKKFYEIGSKYKSSFCYYMLGELAIKTNNTNLAYNYYMKANEIDGSAKSKIGECYEFGYGVAIDLEKAKEWYEKAVSNKDIFARDKLYKVKQKIKKLQEEKQEEQEMKKLEKAMEEFAKSAEELKNVMENGGADVIANAIVNGKQNKSVKVSTKESTKNVRGALDSLIGLEDVKERVEELEDQIVDYNRRIQRGLPASKASMHMVFTGNAGTGKTTVARIIADILKENGIVSKGQLIETDRSGLIGEYIGETGQKTRKVIESAIGGVLFIDEAYALAPKDFGKDYGNEAIAVLLKMMEDHKDDLVVIVAGYKTEMKDFIDANPGLKSRFTTYIDFPDYKENELTEIFKLLASKDENVICEDCFEKLNELWKQAVQVENFGNGRAVRNIYNDVVRRRSRRLRKIASPTNEEMLTILPEDIPETFVNEIK